MTYRSNLRLAALLCAVFFLIGFARDARAQKLEWRPISPEELKETKPLVEPDADAEALIWEERIDDHRSDSSTRSVYVRIKIFTERGRDKYGQISLIAIKGLTNIKDLGARVIQSNGKITELTEEDIYEGDVIKSSGGKARSKALALANLEVGSILEYQYTEDIKNVMIFDNSVELQKEIPIRTLRYYYKPYGSKKPSIKIYNVSGLQFEPAADGFFSLTRTDVPAAREEPFMPPENEARQFGILNLSWYPSVNINLNFGSISRNKVKFSPKAGEDIWPQLAVATKYQVEGFHNRKKDFAELTSKVLKGVVSDEDKVRKIYEFCQNRIHNVSFGYQLSMEERKEAEKKLLNGQRVEVTAEDFEKGTPSASAADIDTIFAIMLAAADLDPWVASVSRRDDVFFTPEKYTNSQLKDRAIAVKINGVPQLFSPGIKYLPFGMQPWYREGAVALYTNGKEFGWLELPLSTYDKNLTRNRGKFRLTADGTLEGEASVELTGQRALTYRLENYMENDATLERDLKDSITARISNAEVTALSVANLEDTTKPIVQHFSIKVPNYAQTTGNRIIFQPAFFRSGVRPLFASSTREYDIFFRTPWSEIDEISISLPEGFKLDNADPPAPVTASNDIAKDEITVKIDAAGSTLTYVRDFHFGGGGAVLFPRSQYENLKTLWDSIDRADKRSILLKRAN